MKRDKSPVFYLFESNQIIVTQFITFYINPTSLKVLYSLNSKIQFDPKYYESGPISAKNNVATTVVQTTRLTYSAVLHVVL